MGSRAVAKDQDWAALAGKHLRELAKLHDRCSVS